MLDSEEASVAEVDPGNDAQAQNAVAGRTFVDVQHQAWVKELQSHTGTQPGGRFDLMATFPHFGRFVSDLKIAVDQHIMKRKGFGDQAPSKVQGWLVAVSEQNP